MGRQSAPSTQVAGVEQYRGGSEAFMALGDERGLLLAMKRGRILDFSATSREKAAKVYPTLARVRGSHEANISLAGYPYELIVEA